MSLFSETKAFFCSLCNKRSLKDATMKTEYFADIISWKQRANQQKKKKKIQGNVFLLNYKPFNYIKDSQTVNPWLILGHFVGYLTHFHDWFGKTQYVLCFLGLRRGKIDDNLLEFTFFRLASQYPFSLVAFAVTLFGCHATYLYLPC